MVAFSLQCYNLRCFCGSLKFLLFFVKTDNALHSYKAFEINKTFIIYIHDLPVTVARKFVYADDLAIMHSAEDWQSMEGTLTQHKATLSSYLQKWKRKLSTTKTVNTAFHLYKEASCELKVAAEDRILPFSAEPTYLRVKLDRSLTYLRHLESLHKKLTRVGFLSRLARSSWGAGARTLRIATLAFIHSAA